MHLFVPLQRTARALLAIGLVAAMLMPGLALAASYPPGLTVPVADPALAFLAPSPDQPNYTARLTVFFQSTIPDTWNGQPVQFWSTYSATGGADVWGLPTSAPKADPNNPSFVYQRFQNGILFYDATAGTTEPLPVGQAPTTNSVLIGQNVPQAQQASLNASTWLPGPNASGDDTYSGSVDQPSSANSAKLSGWVVDTTAAGWDGIDQVQVWDGMMNLGGQLLADAAIQVNRPDVATALNNPYWVASGYSASAPGLTGKPAVYVYAHTPAKGWWYQQVLTGAPAPQSAQGMTLQIETPTPLGTVHSASTFSITGYALDRAASSNQGTGVDRVQVYLDGDRTTGTYIGDASLGGLDKFAAAAGGQFANAGWRLTFQPNSWLANLSDNQISKLTVYAHSAVTDQEMMQQTSIVISVP